MEDINNMRADTQEFIKNTKEEEEKRKEEERLKKQQEKLEKICYKAYKKDEKWKNVKTKNPEDIYLIDNFLNRGLVLLVGKSGIGKSRFTQFTLETMCQTPWNCKHKERYVQCLGHLCYPTEGFYMTLEMDIEEHKTRRKDYGYADNGYMNYLDMREHCNLKDIADFIALCCRKAREQDQRKRNLVFVIDPLMRVRCDVDLGFRGEKSINNNDYMESVLGYFQKLSINNNCSIIIVHHSGKVSDILGATAIELVCNQVLILKKIDEDRKIFKIEQEKTRENILSDINIQSYDNSTYGLLTAEAVAKVDNPKTASSLDTLIEFCKKEWEKVETPDNRPNRPVSNTITKLSIDWITTLLNSDKRFSLQANYFLHSLRNNTQYLAQNGVTWKNLGGRPNRIEITYTPLDVYSEDVDPEPEPTLDPEQVEKEEKQIQIHDDLPF